MKFLHLDKYAGPWLACHCEEIVENNIVIGYVLYIMHYSNYNAFNCFDNLALYVLYWICLKYRWNMMAVKLNI